MSGTSMTGWYAASCTMRRYAITVDEMIAGMERMSREMNEAQAQVIEYRNPNDVLPDASPHMIRKLSVERKGGSKRRMRHRGMKW